MRLARSRTKALVLYGILLGLPALVLVVVLWRQQREDSLRDRQRVPADVSFRADALVEAMRLRFLDCLAPELELRPEEFARLRRVDASQPLSSDGLLELEPTALSRASQALGVRARFFGESQALRNADEFALGLDPERAFWLASEAAAGGRPDPHDALRDAVFTWLRNWFEQESVLRYARSEASDAVPPSIRSVGLLDLVLLRAQLRSYGAQEDPTRPADAAFLVKALGPDALDLSHLRHELVYGDPWASLTQGSDGRPLALWTRPVRYLPRSFEILGQAPAGALNFVANQSTLSATVLAGLGEAGPFDLTVTNMAAVQGWILDLEWFLGPVLEEVATDILGADGFITSASEPTSAPPDHRVDVPLLERLGFEGAEAFPDYGHFTVSVSEAATEARARSRSLRFLAAAGMLLLSFSTGLYFLLSSVNRELEAADRVQNFVSAVTHELRTPVSTIALHTELLQENWVSGEAQRDEYYARIAEEAERLAELVERVLRKARLGSGQTPDEEPPIESDLSELVEAASRRVLAKRQDDVHFELDRSLPMALLTAESIESIVENLVENARKYAPVEAGDEPILVRTFAEGAQVVLEVADRGDGIPRRQAAKVFEAFYRVGSERTRSAKGTGLGLHLVQLQAEALDGRASVHERAGGGALFRIEFPALRPDPEA